MVSPQGTSRIEKQEINTFKIFPEILIMEFNYKEFISIRLILTAYNLLEKLLINT